MEKFTTVFLFTKDVGNSLFPEMVFRLMFGVLVLLGSVLPPVFSKNKKFPILVIIFSSLWITLHLLLILPQYQDYLEAKQIYNNEQYQIAEGIVHVVHMQPESGHDEGDIIEINGTQLEVNFFDSTFGYKNTIAHGGVLKEGIYARLYYHRGYILRVDIFDPLNLN